MCVTFIGQNFNLTLAKFQLNTSKKCYRTVSKLEMSAKHTIFNVDVNLIRTPVQTQ